MRDGAFPTGNERAPLHAKGALLVVLRPSRGPESRLSCLSGGSGISKGGISSVILDGDFDRTRTPRANSNITNLSSGIVTFPARLRLLQGDGLFSGNNAVRLRNGNRTISSYATQDRSGALSISTTHICEVSGLTALLKLLVKTGIAMAVSTAMIATTISSSARVKPLLLFFFIACHPFYM